MTSQPSLTIQDGALLGTNLPYWPCRRGKVRDVYDLGERLLLIASDRISAYDWVMPNGIPAKGKLLNRLSLMWFEFLGVEHHLLSTDMSTLPELTTAEREALTGRSVIVRKTKVVPIECVVRGYLAGSGWQEYQKTRSVCGVALPDGLQQCSQLPEPIFTPATKAEEGHDENISFEVMCQHIDPALAQTLKQLSIDIYQKASRYAQSRGIIIADTKFEFGLAGDKIILIDEVLTPDSSRFWPKDDYQPGRDQASFDKQFLRNWLSTSGWDKNSPPPQLPEEIVRKTLEKYEQAERLLVS
jgi:phosphoribosylaminoimidazole-succinocarboxamide synthase